MLSPALDFAKKHAHSYRIQLVDREDLYQELCIIAFKVIRKYAGYKREDEVLRITRFAMRRRAKKFIWKKRRQDERFFPLTEEDLERPEINSKLPELRLVLETSSLPSQVVRGLLEGYSVREISKASKIPLRSLYKEIEEFRAY